MLGDSAGFVDREQGAVMGIKLCGGCVAAAIDVLAHNFVRTGNWGRGGVATQAAIRVNQPNRGFADGGTDRAIRQGNVDGSPHRVVTINRSVLALVFMGYQQMALIVFKNLKGAVWEGNTTEVTVGIVTKVTLATRGVGHAFQEPEAVVDKSSL